MENTTRETELETNETIQKGPIESSTSNIIPGKDIAIIAHITLIGLIVAFVMNNDKKYAFANYHIRQVLGLAVTGFALGVINIIPILGWLVSILGSLVLVVMWIVGLMNALNGKEKPMPILGKKYEEWFSSVGA